jgi:FKBP-type peptidyl-prolyl cis-trans isomerase 2
MSTAKPGDTVEVHYTGKLDDGTVFDSSEGNAPLVFKIGERKIITGFEDGVVGMKAGESKSVSIPPDQAYGDRQIDLVQEFPRDKLPGTITPEVGQRLQMKQPNGQSVAVVVSGLDDDSIMLDANHPLAGKTLHFDIRLEKIRG